MIEILKGYDLFGYVILMWLECFVIVVFVIEFLEGGEFS